MINKDLIVEVATKMFMKHGVKAITTDRIVSELHISKRTLYEHFEDKSALLNACLDNYNTSVRMENDDIIKSSNNVIEAMGRLHQRIVHRSHLINPSFFRDIIHYYPGLLKESYKRNEKYAHQQLLDLAIEGIREGIFHENMDIEVVGKTAMSLSKMLVDRELFPIDKFSNERLTFGIMLPYLRGLCTKKGIELLQVQEEIFKVKV